MAETNTILKNNYPPIKNKEINKKKKEREKQKDQSLIEITGSYHGQFNSNNIKNLIVFIKYLLCTL